MSALMSLELYRYGEKVFVHLFLSVHQSLLNFISTFNLKFQVKYNKLNLHYYYITQIPQSWRQAIEDPSTIQIFHEYYCSTAPPLSNMAMECLVRLGSVRRSVFQADPERLKFLNRLLTSTTEILRSQWGLNEIQNYNEFCKLLGRLKANFNLQDLVSLSSHISIYLLSAR